MNVIQNKKNMHSELVTRTPREEIAEMQALLHENNRIQLDFLLKYLEPPSKKQLAQSLMKVHRETYGEEQYDIYVYRNYDLITYRDKDYQHKAELAARLVRSLRIRGGLGITCNCNQDGSAYQEASSFDDVIARCLRCLCRFRSGLVNIDECQIPANLDTGILRFGSVLDTDTDYVLSYGLHIVLHLDTPRCAIRLLLTSFGIQNICSGYFKYLVCFYWYIRDYKTLTILYATVKSMAMFDAITQFPKRITEKYPARAADWPLLKRCIAQTTCIDPDWIGFAGMNKLQYLEYAARQPRRLQNCCVISIRNAFHGDVMEMAEHLPLPQRLKDQVRLYNILNDIPT